jgi:hypothetical protein
MRARSLTGTLPGVRRYRLSRILFRFTRPISHMVLSAQNGGHARIRVWKLKTSVHSHEAKAFSNIATHSIPFRWGKLHQPPLPHTM